MGENQIQIRVGVNLVLALALGKKTRLRCLNSKSYIQLNGEMLDKNRTSGGDLCLFLEFRLFSHVSMYIWYITMQNSA